MAIMRYWISIRVYAGHAHSLSDVVNYLVVARPSPDVVCVLLIRYSFHALFPISKIFTLRKITHKKRKKYQIFFLITSNKRVYTLPNIIRVLHILGADIVQHVEIYKYQVDNNITYVNRFLHYFFFIARRSSHMETIRYGLQGQIDSPYFAVWYYHNYIHRLSKVDARYASNLCATHAC